MATSRPLYKWLTGQSIFKYLPPQLPLPPPKHNGLPVQMLSRRDFLFPDADEKYVPAVLAYSQGARRSPASGLE
jgi:hypothetical protein